METYDMIMLGVLGAATILGAVKGFAWQLASLASIVVSYIMAVQFRAPVAAVIGGEPPWNAFLAMLLIYVGTSVVIWFGFRLVAKTIDGLKLRDFDRQIGALFGAAKGGLLCILITLFAVALLQGPQRQSVVDSRSGYYIARLLNRAHPIIPPEVHEVLETYLHSLDERLDEGLDGYGQAHRDELGEAGPSHQAAADDELYR